MSFTSVSAVSVVTLVLSLHVASSANTCKCPILEAYVPTNFDFDAGMLPIASTIFDKTWNFDKHMENNTMENTIDPQFSNFNSLEEKWWEHEMNDGYETNESFNERSIQLRTFIFINNVLFPLYFTIDSHILNIYADIY